MAKAKSTDVVAEEGAVQALFEFGYDAEHPRVERGEVFVLSMHANDQTLLDLRYVARVAPGTELVQCGICGKLFVNDETRTVHGDTWHSYVCECGYVAHNGDHRQRAADLAAHREKCPVMRDLRSDQRQMHRNEVRAIKQATPVTVAG